jgi:hypothetical protein
MLWTILIVLLLLWLVGFYGGFVTNSLIHLLLIAAVIVLALNLFKHRNPAEVYGKANNFWRKLACGNSARCE